MRGDQCLVSRLSNIKPFFLSTRHFVTVRRWCRHSFFRPCTDIILHKMNPATLRWYPVCHLLYFTSLDDSPGFLFSPFHFLMSESLPYSPPPRASQCNRLGAGGQRVSSDRKARTLAVIPACALGVLPPLLLLLLLSEQVLTDSQVNVQRPTLTPSPAPPSPEWNQKHRPRAAPNGVPNASSPGCSKAEMKDEHLSQQMRKQICFKRLSELKKTTQPCTCSLLLVGIWDRERSCFHMMGVCVFS